MARIVIVIIVIVIAIMISSSKYLKQADLNDGQVEKRGARRVLLREHQSIHIILVADHHHHHELLS